MRLVLAVPSIHYNSISLVNGCVPVLRVATPCGQLAGVISPTAKAVTPMRPVSADIVPVSKK